MIDAILSFDRQLFFLINHSPHSVFFDEIAKALSGIGTWGAVWIVIAILLFLREEKRDRLFFVPSILVLIAGNISEFFLKTWVARPRPSLDMGAILVGSADTFSFPSSHAFFAFGFACVLSREEPKLRGLFYALAILIALSRVYLGVHYPLDIIVGGLLGWGIGKIALGILRT